MKASLHTRAVAAAVALGAMCACAGPNAGRSAAVSPPPAGSGSTAELEALYRARTDSALTRFTEADVHFMTGMIGHHAQALVMAGWAPSHGASASLRTLAARTINAQQDEIDTMEAWLGDRHLPVPEIHVSGSSLHIEGGMADMGAMPGMLSDDQMRELDAARGSEFDRLFLMFMIQHHSGAVAMVHELFATDGAALGETVFKIASDIQVDQTSEIDRMRAMLEALPATGRRQ